MGFEEWKGKFVTQESNTEESFRPMSLYRQPDGSFDIDAAKEDYRNFLQTVPEKNRMYLEQAMDGVEYQQRKLKRSPFGYSKVDDAILFDSSHPAFAVYDFRVVNTHELSHRIDRWFVHSSEQTNFIAAIQAAESTLDKDPGMFTQFCAQYDNDGFLSDIVSAICKGKYEVDFGHDAAYWTPEKQAKEIFANLFSLQAYGDEEKLEFLGKHFSEMIECFNSFEFLV